MAGEALERAGMHFDDLNRIRVLDEDTSSQVGLWGRGWERQCPVIGQSK